MSTFIFHKVYCTILVEPETLWVLGMPLLLTSCLVVLSPTITMGFRLDRRLVWLSNKLKSNVNSLKTIMFTDLGLSDITTNKTIHYIKLHVRRTIILKRRDWALIPGGPNKWLARMNYCKTKILNNDL